MLKHWSSLIHIRLLSLKHLPLAALIPPDFLHNALKTWSYLAVALFVMIESSGIPFPGETMLLLASFYAAVDPTLHLQLPIVIACAALGAIVGDNIGYTVGRTGGHAFVQRFGHYLFLKPAHLVRAERFFAKHGDKTVFFGRFIAVLRAWAAFLAGLNNMRWSSFLIYNAVGGIIWAIIYGCLGFFAGIYFYNNFGAVEHLAGTISWAGAILIVAAIIVAYIVFRLRRKRHAQAELGLETKGSEEAQITKTKLSSVNGHTPNNQENSLSTIMPEIPALPDHEQAPVNQQNAAEELAPQSGIVSSDS
ncbi:MAG: DedA family protein [Ktedonobacteraceae bacterium]